MDDLSMSEVVAHGGRPLPEAMLLLLESLDGTSPEWPLPEAGSALDNFDRQANQR